MALSQSGNIHMIAAVGRNGELGLKGDLPWPKNGRDLRLFNQLTRDCNVVVGAATWPSVKHLQGTSNRRFIVDPPNHPAQTIAQACWDKGGCEVWIAGGAKTYRKWAPFIDGLKIVSFLDYHGEADTFFPFDAFGIHFTPNPSLHILGEALSGECLDNVREGYAQARLNEEG